MSVFDMMYHKREEIHKNERELPKEEEKINCIQPAQETV